MLKSLVLAASLALCACASASEEAVKIPAPALDQGSTPAGMRTAVIAGGCFWGVQGVYQHMNGVHNVISGYAGGDAARANYEDVSTGRSGHAEAVQIFYDPSKVTYGQILQVFFSVVHDPTQLNRQGPDVGPQYRSAIFHRNAEEKRIAEAYIAQLGKAGVYRQRIVTRVDALTEFHAAEDYHQDYMKHHPTQPYIVYHDAPKIAHLKQRFAALYRE